AHDEWRRYGHGAWNYDSNETILKKFWADGMRRIDHTETTVTVGMRGDGDKPMTEGTAISLLERIVRDQREIIAQTTGKPAEATPQVWALYKEVQDYYDKGMRVPDDVTLLLCDDNWGNIRRLPAPTDKPRKGGYGIYYHFDYVGDPRNYKWLNTNQIERTWEQMHLAYNYGVNKIWVVNVGDIKPMEFPISFFLDYAWNPRRWNEDNLSAFYTNWCTNQFGEKYAKQIGHIIQQYTQFNARRKPELLSPETYSLENYQEADQVVSAWHQLLAEAEKINAALPDAYRDAFFELVLHPVKACSNLNELYVTVAKNRWYASRQSTLANDFADKAKQLYINDSLISLEYNNQVAHGKWHHMMDQTHIGYTYWQQPPFNKMPELSYVTEKSSDTKDDPAPKLASRDARLLVPKRTTHPCFFEQDGIVSIAAAHYSTSIHGPQMAWKIIPNIGREDAGISSFPVTLDYQHFDRSNPRLEYEFYSYDSDACSINSYFSPTLNIHNAAEGLQYAISIDGEKPAIVSVNKDDSDKKTWEGWVASNIIIRKSMHHVSAPGRHTLTYWMISPALVLQKIVVDFGGLKESYLGPPETRSR
ncbi:MAG TPA: glycosyl hydrolase 115 family protein, partial [Puia sp.]|nr:glycosyl hydrolase 115 family protein [Puia sp.]